MSWVGDAVQGAVSAHAQTNGGRVIAGLAAQGDKPAELASLLLAAACQNRSDEAHRYLAEASGNPHAARQSGDTGVPTLDPARPKFQRPNGDWYYARPWDRFWDVEVLKKARENGKFVLLLGPPGTGKTAMAEAAFGDELMEFIVTAETRVGNLVGSFIPEGDHFVWVKGPLQIAVEEGLPILLDEILLGDPTVLSLLYPLMDGRGFLAVDENPEIGIIYAKEGFYIVGSGNPDVPGVNPSEALLSRFDIHIEVTTDWPLAKMLGVDPAVVDMIETIAVRASGPNPSISWSPQFRELLAFKDLEETWGRSFAFRNLMRKFPPGDVGEVQETLGNRLTLDMLQPASII